MGKLVTHPLAPLLLFAVILTALLTTYPAAGFAPSESFETVAAFAWSFLVLFWIVADARRRIGIPCFDFGFLCYAFLPLAVPWYCFWSRGWRGAMLLLMIFGLWAGPHILANIIGSAIYR
jgi:hypothetical protein